MLRYFLFVFIMLVVASCGSAPPEETDWCWTFDFRVGQGGFNIAEGQWLDTVGLQTVDGQLSFSFEHSQFVEPAIVFITVSRPDGVTGDIPVTAAGTIFGSSAGFSVTMPGASDEETVWFQPAAIGDAGTQINVSVDTDTQEINLEEIRVEGNGQTPFASNPCADPAEIPTNTLTATAEDFTPSPTNTPTPTITPSQTFTPSPTDTPDIFTPTNTLDPNPTPVSVPPCTPTGCIYDHYEFTDSEINNQEWGYSRTMIYGFPSQPDGVDGGETCYNQSSSGGANVQCTSTYYFEGDSLAVTNIRFWFRQFSTNPSYDGVLAVFATFYDETLTPYAQCQLDLFNEEEIGIFADWTEYNKSTAGCAGASDAYQMHLVIGQTTGFNPHNTSIYVDNLIISVSDYDPPPTHTPQTTNTPVATLTKTPIPTNTSSVKTPIVKNTAVPTVDLTQETATPQNTLPATPTYITSTYVPSVTPYQTNIPEGTATPDVQEIRENEAEYEILDEMQNNQNWLENVTGGLFDFLGGAFGWLFQSIADLFKMIYDFFNFIFGLIAAMFAVFLEIVQIILLVIQLLFGLLGLLLLYIQQLIARLTALFTAFFTAPPLPIPGLPLCISDPLSYDICAVYYVADYTVFAPNTPGQYIIPLVWALMNIIIIFRAVKYILKFIKRGEDVTR